MTGGFFLICCILAFRLAPNLLPISYDRQLSSWIRETLHPEDHSQFADTPLFTAPPFTIFGKSAVSFALTDLLALRLRDDHTTGVFPLPVEFVPL